MKTLLLAISIFAMSLLSAQNCVLQNPDFETYSPLVLGTDTIHVPNDYNPLLSLLLSTLNGGIPGIDTTHDAYSGNVALEFYRDTTNNVPFGGDVLAIIPCSQYPSLNGYYKLENPGVGDSAAIGIIATAYDTLNNRRDTVINEGLFLGAASSYTAFNFTPVPISFSLNIDTIQLYIIYLPMGDQTSFKLDSLTLNTFVVGLEDQGSTPKTEAIRFYPNPSMGLLHIEAEEAIDQPLQIVNHSGQVVLEERLTKISSQIDISHLANGVYFVRYGDRVQKLLLAE